MFRALARRLVTGALTLFLVTMLVFLLVHLAPGSPLGGEADSAGLRRPSPEAIAQLERIYHLDQPLHRQ